MARKRVLTKRRDDPGLAYRLSEASGGAQALKMAFFDPAVGETEQTVAVAVSNFKFLDSSLGPTSHNFLAFLALHFVLRNRAYTLPSTSPADRHLFRDRDDIQGAPLDLPSPCIFSRPLLRFRCPRRKKPARSPNRHHNGFEERGQATACATFPRQAQCSRHQCAALRQQRSPSG